MLTGRQEQILRRLSRERPWIVIVESGNMRTVRRLNAWERLEAGAVYGMPTLCLVTTLKLWPLQPGHVDGLHDSWKFFKEV
jgi:hypothetical protein